MGHHGEGNNYSHPRFRACPPWLNLCPDVVQSDLDSINSDARLDHVANAVDQFQDIFRSVIPRADRRQNLQVNVSRNDAFYAFAHDQSRVVDDDRNDRNARLDGHIKHAPFELLDAPVNRARAFGKGHKRMPPPQLVRAAPRAFNRALPVATVNRHDMREREPLLHYRNAEQFDLCDGADVVTKVGEEQRRIEIALMIGDEDVRLIAIKMFKP